jgi:hypothetical protein
LVSEVIDDTPLADALLLIEKSPPMEKLTEPPVVMERPVEVIPERSMDKTVEKKVKKKKKVGLLLYDFFCEVELSRVILLVQPDHCMAFSNRKLVSFILKFFYLYKIRTQANDTANIVDPSFAVVGSFTESPLHALIEQQSAFEERLNNNRSLDPLVMQAQAQQEAAMSRQSPTNESEFITASSPVSIPVSASASFAYHQSPMHDSWGTNGLAALSPQQQHGMNLATSPPQSASQHTHAATQNGGGVPERLVSLISSAAPTLGANDVIRLDTQSVGIARALIFSFCLYWFCFIPIFFLWCALVVCLYTVVQLCEPIQSGTS